jgi:hypothetical protein
MTVPFKMRQIWLICGPWVKRVSARSWRRDRVIRRLPVFLLRGRRRRRAAGIETSRPG